MRQIDCTYLLTGKGVQSNQTIDIEDERISALRPRAGASKPRLLAMPALVNAHDHGRAVRTSSIDASGKPLEAWLQYLALFPAVDPYLAAAVSLGNSALGGAGIVMVHYTRAQGFTDLPAEAAEVAHAARDVGVRVGFAVSMKDRNPIGYGPPEPLLDALPARRAMKSSAALSAHRFSQRTTSSWSMRSPRPPTVRISTCSMGRTGCSGAATRC